MRYIDADTHVFESERTWEYLPQSEREFKPIAVTADGDAVQKRMWLVGDQLLPRRGADTGLLRNSMEEVGEGARDLSDVPLRLRWMDQLGVDTQVVFPTFFLLSSIKRPEVELALARCYNRWMADVSAESQGRLRWIVVPSVKNIEASLAELEFGKRHGAVGVLLRPLEQERPLCDPYFDPLYAKAEELDLAISVHIGLSFPSVYALYPKYSPIYSTVPIIGTFYSIVTSDLWLRFPRLRFGFLEGRSSWLPWVLQEARRAGAVPDRDPSEPTVLEERRLFVACMEDDDLPYLLPLAGRGAIVIGSDFGHTDRGTALTAHRTLENRTDVEPDALVRILNQNARALYGLS